MDRSEAGKKGYQKTGHIIREQQAETSRISREMYEANPNICPSCNEILPYEKRRNKFCDKSCAASFNNHGVIRVETVNSQFCGHCSSLKEKRHNKYCNACIENCVYTNTKDDPSDIKSEGTLRNYLRRTREHRCEDCGLTTWKDQLIPLEVHHIDGNPDNNADENLQRLCLNCHALTDNFRANGIKNGALGRYSRRREMRRKRYSDGGSY